MSSGVRQENEVTIAMAFGDILQFRLFYSCHSYVLDGVAYKVGVVQKGEM